MPLLGKKPFDLVKPPDDLRPEEHVWQVRFTDEVFRSYEEYLKRINLYRQRVWICKATGKRHLTYEEALVSEQQASEKILRFPKEFEMHVLRLVQFSMLRQNDLVNMIYERFKDFFVEGEELNGRVGNSVHPRKILKVINNNKGLSYEVRWLEEEGKTVSTSIEDSKNLIRKKPPFSRDLLRLFIRESTSQNAPWVVHDKLAMKHGITVEPPEELREKMTQNLKMSEECMSRENLKLENEKGSNKKRAIVENGNSAMAKKTRTALESSQKLQKEETKVAIIKYPIDDLLVKPCADDPVFSDRPVPSTNFLVPMNDVGSLLMVWDFCSCFGKLLHLSPFSLEEFEYAIVYEGISNLIVEAHCAILRLLIDDQGEYYTLIQEKNRKTMVTSNNWTEYLIDYLQLEKDSTDHLVKIERGRYYKLSVRVKLEIFGGLVYCALATNVIRGQIDMYIQQYHALLATKKEEDLEEVGRRREEKQRIREEKQMIREEKRMRREEEQRKREEKRMIREEKQRKREEKHLKGTKDSNNDSPQANSGSNTAGICVLDSMHSCGQAKRKIGDVNMEAPATLEINHSGKRGSKLDVLASRRALMKQHLETKEREKETALLVELNMRREKNKIHREKRQKRTEKKLKEEREELFDREIGKLFMRTNTLGKDRDHNRYWFFQREGRVFVESADHKQWGFYTSKEELDGLLGSLNPKGKRELALKKQLEKHYHKICSALQKRTKDMAEKDMDETVILDTSVLRRSVRVTAQPKDRKVPPLVEYVNKWRR
ncbi:uncharacterized protein LOC143891635 [Tasmannia lanceolata]|uniref:uncharacterized protein LOC143891635 n=1 Tax=Tasmannia lanceolata TaxID=3420 RepID=UPI0040634F4F